MSMNNSVPLDLTHPFCSTTSYVRAQYEYVHPSSLREVLKPEESRRVAQRVNAAWKTFTLPNSPCCIVNTTLPSNTPIVLNGDANPQFQYSASKNDIPWTNYRDPLESKNILIRNNPWTPTIIRLRCIRLRVTCLLQHITDFFLRGNFRETVDTLSQDNPIRHYFYCHCPIFRFLKPDTPMLLQGFNLRCIHSTQLPKLPILELYPQESESPFLTDEEDEFLTFVAMVFHLEHWVPIANSLRHLRQLNIVLEEDVYLLLHYGYLDPEYYFDGYGNHCSITWKNFIPTDF
ncbi:hypothetical protein BDN71DRAFT_1436249 [Pleurotus eryngii]|uniref:Uncharacterized protein n=1 Tax=Pleurotus eryngii TaxID=5323 RepID=A0A9P6DA31_PLEER|nr:hypothetical protein BDN71DRAFT_1436249 [Pleurotus eryngii]